MRLRCPKCPVKHYYGVALDTMTYNRKAGNIGCPNCSTILVPVG